MSKAKILYDSHCKLCNAEIEYYMKKDPDKIFEYLDIMSPEFDATHFKLTKADVHKYFHVIDENGKILKGVEAFYYIWVKLDTFFILRGLFNTTLGRKALEFGYHGFIKLRPYLPRKDNCDDGYCEI